MRAARLGCLLVTALVGLSLTGCWSRLETNELALVISFGADWHHGTYQVIASVLDPKAVGVPTSQSTSTSNKPAHILMTGTGRTAGEALADLDRRSSRRALWSASQVAVIGEGLARHGINPLLAAITHLPSFRPTMRLLIAHGDARAIYVLDHSGLETSVGRQLYLMAQNTHRAQSFLWAPHVFDVRRWQAQQGRATLLPGVVGAPTGLPQEQPYSMPDSAVLQGGRLVAWLPRSEVRSVLWVEGLFVHGQFNVPCPRGSGHQGVVSLAIARSRVRPVVDAARIAAFDVKLSGRGSVLESCPGATPAQMGEAATRTVSGAVQAAVHWAQARHLDVFGFGETAYRRFPHVWLAGYQRDWPESFAHMPVHLFVHVAVTQPGLSR